MAKPSRTRPRELPAFTRTEFENRAERARKMMTEAKLDAVMVSSEPNVEYLSGFTTQFAWNTPTRPWYFVLPRTGKPVGVIPEIGAENWLGTSWVPDIRTWASPRPDNEGLDLLADAIQSVRRRYGRIGVELGAESRLGMPVGDLRRLERMVRPVKFADAVPMLRELRMIKSKAEITRIRHVCEIVSDAFDAMPKIFRTGDTERDLTRKFQAALLERGADKTPFTAIGSGRGGYESIIMGPTRRKIGKGDIFMIDTGTRYGGYFSDFDRNYSVGPASDTVRRVHDALWRATEAGIDAARPGNTAEDIFTAQARVLDDAGIAYGKVGRMGHGLGKVLTEPPSNMAGDRTPLRPGMVMTIEPSASYGRGKTQVHEENVLVTKDKPVMLSRRGPREIPELKV